MSDFTLYGTVGLRVIGKDIRLPLLFLTDSLLRERSELVQSIQMALSS